MGEGEDFKWIATQFSENKLPFHSSHFLFVIFVFVFFYQTQFRSLAMLVTHSVRPYVNDFHLEDKIDVTLAREDANSNLVEVVTFANVDDEDRIGNSLLQTWKLRFGHKAKLLFRLWAQGLVNIFKFKFRQDFQAGVWSVFCR